MPSLVPRIIGAIGLVLGVAWVVWPMRMIKLQYRVFYFWAEVPDLENHSATLARVSGAVLAVLGGALVVGVLP